MSELQVAPQQFAHITSARIVHRDLIDSHSQILRNPARPQGGMIGYRAVAPVPRVGGVSKRS